MIPNSLLKVSSAKVAVHFRRIDLLHRLRCPHLGVFANSVLGEMRETIIYFDVSGLPQDSILKKSRARKIGYVHTRMVDDEDGHCVPHQRAQHRDASNDILSSTPSYVSNGELRYLEGIQKTEASIKRSNVPLY